MARAERPLDAGDGAVLRIASELRKLRQQAGSPAYRELSRRAHYSVGALSDAAGGRKLPSLAVTLAYVRACDGDVAEWTRRWHAAAAELVEDGETDSSNPEQAPYLGLTAFQATDAERFFGRDELVTELRELVSRKRFTVVVGPSGSGKSSLLRAGLQPDLVRTPGPHPNADGIRETGGVVVIDQFEEVFTLCRDEDERERFIAELAAAARASDSLTRIVLGLRADFYAHCARYPELARVLGSAQLLVGPMTTDELRAAVGRPAVCAGLRVETALMSQIVADATGQAGVLPLVSHALLETWRRRRGGVLTLTGYREAGGITNAIARTAEAAYADLSADDQTCARHLFVRLVALGEGTEDTKRRVGYAELEGCHAVLERLASARLVTLDRDEVQITHEALIRCWPRLRDWLRTDREQLRLHRQLTEAAQGWEAAGHDPDMLYRGSRLDLVRDLDPATLTAVEQAFLLAATAATERRTHRRRLVALAAAVLLALTTATSAYALRTNLTVSRQRDNALAEKAGAEAVALRQTDPALAARLGLAAHRITGTPDTLLSALATTVAGHTQAVSSVAFSQNGHLMATGSFDHTAALWNVTDPRHPVQLAVLKGHTDLVAAVAFSPDGRTLATAGRDQVIRLWDVATGGQTAMLTGHTDTIYSVAFSPDGRTLASGSYDRTARLWNAATGAPLAVLTGHALSVKPVAFSSLGVLATGSDDRTVRLWNVSDPAHPALLNTLTGHTDLVAAAAFSPDGRTLATAGNDHTIRLWDTATGATTDVLTGHTDVVASLAFAPDGRRLVSGGYDHTVRLWTLDRRRPTVLTGHSGAVNAVAFSPDGQTIASASDDHTAALWGVDVGRAESQACGPATRQISEAEWDAHFPGMTYRAPCPGTGPGDEERP